VDFIFFFYKKNVCALEPKVGMFYVRFRACKVVGRFGF
jgi:hypothetical protein